jgi:hypothetical protein
MPEPSKGTPDRIRGDGGLGEAGPWTLRVCVECGDAVAIPSAWVPTEFVQFHRHSAPDAPGWDVGRNVERVEVEVVPASRLAAAEQRAAEAERERDLLSSRSDAAHELADRHNAPRTSGALRLNFVGRLDDLIASLIAEKSAAERQVEALRKDRRQSREAIKRAVVWLTPGTTGETFREHALEALAAALAQQGETP